MGKSESEEKEASSVSGWSKGTDRIYPPKIAAVTTPGATYTVVDADTDDAPVEAVTVIV